MQDYLLVARDAKIRKLMKTSEDSGWRGRAPFLLGTTVAMVFFTFLVLVPGKEIDNFPLVPRVGAGVAIFALAGIAQYVIMKLLEKTIESRLNYRKRRARRSQAILHVPISLVKYWLDCNGWTEKDLPREEELDTHHEMFQKALPLYQSICRLRKFMIVLRGTIPLGSNHSQMLADHLKELRRVLGAPC